MAAEDIECPECHKQIPGAAREKHALDHWDFKRPDFSRSASKEAQERLAILLGKEEK